MPDHAPDPIRGYAYGPSWKVSRYFGQRESCRFAVHVNVTKVACPRCTIHMKLGLPRREINMEVKQMTGLESHTMGRRTLPDKVVLYKHILK